MPESPGVFDNPLEHGNDHSRDRRESILSNFLPENLPSSFLETGPIAREILSRDIEECSSSDGEDDDDNAANAPHHHHGSGDNDSTKSGLAQEDAKLAFHPNGVAYGCGFSTVPLPGIDRPVPNPREIEESLAEELSLLRENGIIQESTRPRHGSMVGSIYRVFGHSHEHLHQPQSGPATPLAGPANETTALLDGAGDVERQNTPPPAEIHQLWEEAVAAQKVKTTWQHEVKTLVSYSGPLIATFLLHYSVTIGSVLTVGRLGMLELGAVNLATMTASITCYVPVQGLSTCLDTLCSQAFGSGHKKLVGLQSQRMTWLLWMLMVPIAALWWFSEPVLAALVPDKDTARLAAQYLRILIIGMPGVAAFESGKRFVQSQGLFHATTYTLLIGAPLSFFQNWLFAFHFGWSFAGAAMAMAVTQNLLPLLLMLYVRLFEGMECWGGFSKKAFSNWGPMIKLAFPGMIMIEAQFSVLEVLTISAASFGTAKLAAQSVLVTVTSTAFNIPFPLAIATSTRVANLIGAGLSDAARVTAKVAIVAACVVGAFNLTILAGLRGPIARVFTDNDEVIEIVKRVILVCAVMEVFDSLAAVSHGILRGVGRQAIGGYANLFSYYVVALPVGLSTAFALGWELAGLWVGLTAGLAVVSGLEILYLYNANWELAVLQAEKRMRSEDVNNSERKQSRHEV
ncbi:mate-domain-containing protein [Apodospora peruviana]|uniref:Mate-domain-containing protein n=1 Tax=Apodospora peruviana TaxID=516989 RepID=A0AAE0HSS5_9PEZI|nr:mate-domain-containing protein [Apodospora peruviana]